MQDLKSFYEDKTILVTGGVGSIGSEIVRIILKYNPKVVRVLDSNETGLFDLEQELQSEKIRAFIGDIRDRDRLKRAVENVDVVFHAAALKHVPLCEYNPFEAAKTNVLGTQNIIEAAMEEEVEKIITISTDKAVNPVNVMGATKLLAERLTVSANFYKGGRKTALSCVRFGNVLYSRGSVLPLFEEQIKKGFITLTDPNMTRFIMKTSQAVGLILKTAKIAKGGEIFILKMPAVRVKDLAVAVIEESAPKYEYKPGEIEIKTIGKRAGEKTHEELMTEDEAGRALETEDMFIVPPEMKDLSLVDKFSYASASEAESKAYTAKDEKHLSKEELKEFLYHENLLL